MRESGASSVREAVRRYEPPPTPASRDTEALEALILRAHDELGLRLERTVGQVSTSEEDLRNAALRPLTFRGEDERRQLEALILEAKDRLGLRLEMVGDLQLWEASPGLQHQLKSRNIGRSLRKIGSPDRPCQCLDIPDLLIRFPNGSMKQPDISIFCETPGLPDHKGAVTVVPEAVIEVISEGSEIKDRIIGPSFYLSQGVKDVVVLEPDSGEVLHYTANQVRTLQSVATIQLECGCTVKV